MQRLSICFFLIFLGVSLGLGSAALLQATKSLEKNTSAALLTGKTALSFEKTFDELLRVRNLARDGWGIFEYSLFNEGRKNIVLGKDGWIFSAEEFAWPKNAQENINNNLAYMSDVTQTLAKRGIPFKIVLLPSKTRLFDTKLTKAIPKERVLLYDELLQFFVQKKIPVQDLRMALLADGTFFKTDTHWTPLGALKTAQSLFNTKAASAQITDAPAHRGDLLKYLPLGSLTTSFGYAPEENKALALTQTSDISQESLFDDAGPRLHLVGTSYSANETWGFAKALEAASGMRVENYAQEGQGPFTVMKDYLAKTDITVPQLVVWEIPERYFPYPFEGPSK